MVQFWYSSLTAVASGKNCVMMQGVKQLLVLSIVDILVVSPRLHGQPNNVVQVFIISAIECCPSAASLYQFTCSSQASPQHVVAWFVEASHCRLRVVASTD